MSNYIQANLKRGNKLQFFTVNRLDIAKRSRSLISVFFIEEPKKS